MATIDMIEPLNPWIGAVLARAERIYEDSDRKCRAAMLFHNTIRQVHRLATHSAIRTPTPKLERYQGDEESPALMLEWYDDASAWHLFLAVRRGFNVRPHLVLDFNGSRHYSVSKPTDEQIRQALFEYFEKWKTDSGAVATGDRPGTVTARSKP